MFARTESSVFQMIEEKALIVETRDDIAWVETQRKSTCSSCQVQKGCGTSVLHKVLGQKRTRLKVLNPNLFEVGDEIVLGLQENALIKGSLMLYALPLIAMFVFSILGYSAFSLYELEFTEGFEILFSLSGLVSGFIWVSKYNKNISSDPNFQAVILSKTAGSPASTVSLI